MIFILYELLKCNVVVLFLLKLFVFFVIKRITLKQLSFILHEIIKQTNQFFKIYYKQNNEIETNKEEINNDNP